MIMVGVKNGVVELCVSIDPDYEPVLREMYPEHLLMPQVGSENVGWTYDGSTFSPPG